MSDSTVNLDPVSQSTSQPAVQVNNLVDALSPSSIFGRRASQCGGLVFAYYGGRFNGTSVANGTVTATASNTNYVVAHRSTLVVSIATTNTNWNDTTTYGRMYLLTAGGSTITAYEDHRASTDGTGIFSTLSGGVSSVDITQPAAGITASGGPITSTGSITLALANDLAALEGLGDGYPKRTGADTWTNKTATQVTADLDVVVGDSGSGGTKGLVPAPSAGDAAAGKFLSASGGYSVPPGGSSLTLTEAPSNQSYTGIIVSLTYGESLVPGDPIYIKSDGKVWKADANGSSTYPCVGLAMETASSGSHIVLLTGIYRDDSLFAWTVGGIVYLSTGGALTQTQPSATDDVIQIIGIATHADRMYVNPQLHYITHT